VWICVVVGDGVRNLDPGALPVALALTGLLGMVAKWHCSQLVPEGMCAPRPAGLVGGITIIFEIPTNDAEPIVGPWHETHVVMPEWFISDPLNLAPFGTGVAAMLDPAPT